MNSIEKAAAFDIERVKNYLRSMNLAQNLTQAEVTQFIEIAQGFGLNPFKREIYASKYGNNFSVIVGYETYIKRAERSGRLSGCNHHHSPK
jgi:recombinational DNA repair protein RecT